MSPLIRARGTNSLNSPAVQSAPEPLSASNKPTIRSTSTVSAGSGTPTFAGCVLHVPTLRYQTEKTAAVTEGDLDRVMCQVVQREMRGMLGLFLPRDRPIRTGTSEHARAVGLLHDLNPQHCLTRLR